MTLLGSIDHQIARRCTHAAILDVRCNTVPRTFQCNEVRFRATTRQRTETTWTIIQQIAKPANHACFDHCRRWTIAPRACVLIEHRSERVGPHADRQRRRIELPEVSGAGNAHRVWRHVAAKSRQDVFDRRAVLEQRCEPVGARRADRTAKPGGGFQAALRLLVSVWMLIGTCMSSALAQNGSYFGSDRYTFAGMSAQVYTTMFGPSEFHATGLLEDWDITARLPEIAVPTLLLAGEQDQVVPLATSPYGWFARAVLASVIVG